MHKLHTLKLVIALVSAVTLAPVAGFAQSAPSSWASKDGRWNSWKDGEFATSEAHFNALKAAAKGGVKLTPMTVPDWSGIWTGSRRPGWFGPVYQNKPGTPVAPSPANEPRAERPVLTPAYQKKLEEELDRVARGIQWDYLSYCLPAGFPRWYSEPFLREFVPTAKQTWMTNEMQSETRRIYTDGRGHVPADERYPLFEGDSIGFWDGDTLIIHTINVKAGNWNRLQPEYSDKTETIELVKKNAQGLMETRMTVYDPESLQKPWHVIWGSELVDLTPTPNLRIDMWSCNENGTNVAKTADGATQFVLPGEEGYKDPNAFHIPPKE